MCVELSFLGKWIPHPSDLQKGLPQHVSHTKGDTTEIWPPSSLLRTVSCPSDRKDTEITGVSLHSLLLEEVPFAFEGRSC